MDLRLPTEGLENYKSASQRARISSESWGASNLYCPCCDSNRLAQTPGNTPAIDYRCPLCDAGFQLKCSTKPFGRRLLDGAYTKMREAIRHGDTPHFFLMSYELDSMLVRNLLCIPDFALTESALEKRKPLASTARRAGWVGCNIMLDRIPSDARIPIVKENRPAPPAEVRRAFKRLQPLASLKLDNRGWTLDVLNAIGTLGKREFELPEIYALEGSLKKLHPENHHIQPKIRQQLQVLRDHGLLEFLGSASYKLV